MARLVIVDDIDGIRALLRDYLSIAAPDVEVVGEATNGAEAIDLVGALQPDAVILDWQMPVLDGLGAAPGLRAVAPDAVIVMYSSRGSYGAGDALAAGVDAYVGKEEGPSRVVEELTSHLEARRRRD